LTDLSRLKVSLTKEGAHKAFFLLRELEISDVLNSTRGVVEGINIDLAQTRNILSANSDGQLPDIWKKAKDHSEDTLRYLVFLAIIFSHHQLIAAFQVGSRGNGQGAISRGDLSNEKVFTNIRGETVNLNLADWQPDVLEYDLRPLFRNEVLGKLATELFRLKLIRAGWSGQGSVADEAVEHGFHRALAKDEQAVRAWLEGTPEGLDIPDPDREVVRNFAFLPGHNPSKEGTSKRRKPEKPKDAELVHNELQNKLYEYLSGLHGADRVGTEVPSGTGGNSIDLVLCENETFTFFEIKTDASVRMCIRHALPQLLEYSYWPSENRSSKLVIVAEAKLTRDAASYLEKLRAQFQLPIYYKQIDRATGGLT